MTRETWLIDIGNTHTTGARLTDGGWETPWQMSTADFLTQGRFPGVDFESHLILSSVVPQVDIVLKRFYPHPFFITYQNLPQLKLNLEKPEEVGSDRIVNALAAYIITSGPVLIVDCGTALTWCYVDRTGTYQGGAIFPGTHLCTQALAEHTAKIGAVPFVCNLDLVGKTTVAAVQVGITNVFVQAINGMIATFKDREPDLVVFGTGNGLLPLQIHLNVDRYEPHLIFHGLAYCAQKIAGTHAI